MEYTPLYVLDAGHHTTARTDHTILPWTKPSHDLNCVVANLETLNLDLDDAVAKTLVSGLPTKSPGPGAQKDTGKNQRKQTAQIQPWKMALQAQKDTEETTHPGRKARRTAKKGNSEKLDSQMAKLRHQTQHGNKTPQRNKGWKRDLTREGVEPNPGPPKKHGAPKPTNKGPKKGAPSNKKPGNWKGHKGDGNKKGDKALAASAADAVAAAAAVVDINKGAIPCKFGAKCNKGLACPYQHPDFIPGPQNFSDPAMPACHDWQNHGKCSYVGCKFYHAPTNLPTPPKPKDLEPEQPLNPVPSDQGRPPPTNKSELPPKTKKVDPPDWDGFRGLVALHFVAAGMNANRYPNAKLKIRPWMTQSSIPNTLANVEIAIAYVQEEGVKHLRLLSSDQAFLYAKKNKYHEYRLDRDTTEGEASEMWFFNPVRWYHSVTRDVRLWFYEVFGDDPGSSGPKPIPEQSKPFPTIKSHCPEEALVLWLEEHGKTMDDLLNNRINDALPEGCTFRLPSTVNLKCEEELPYPVGFTIESNGLWIPRKCWHSEALMLLSRQLLGTNPQSTPASRKDVYSHGQSLLRELWGNQTYTPFDKESQEEMYLNNKTTAQRKTFADGKTRLASGLPVQYRKKCFPKVEVMTFKELGKRHPRNISGNDPDGTYLASVGPDYYQYQKDMSEQLFSKDDSIYRTRLIYTGGMRGDKVGELATAMEDEGLNPAEVDLSRCDGHCSEEARDAEMTHYAEDDMSPETLAHLAEDKEGHGVTNCGIKFKDGPAEGSGRPDTSYGTSLRIFFIWCTYLHFYYWTELTTEDLSEYDDDTKFAYFRILLNGPTPNPEIDAARLAFLNGSDKIIQLGDDSVLGQKGQPSASLIDCVFRAAGHEPKTKVHDASSFDDVTFCSSRFWRVGGGRRILGNMPFRTLHKTFISTDNALRQKDMPGYIAGIARGYKHFLWLPVLGTVMQTIVTKADKESIETKTSRASVNPYKITMSNVDYEIDKGEVASHFFAVYNIDIETFNYVEDVAWLKPGTEWDLPFMRKGLQVDGLAKDDIDPNQAHP